MDFITVKTTQSAVRREGCVCVCVIHTEGVVCNCMNRKAVCVRVFLGLQQHSPTLWAQRVVLVIGASSL